MKNTTVWVLSAILFLCTGSAQAQVNTYNQVPEHVRRNAVCREYYINGAWLNTFGEGRCPPGSRRPGTSIYGSDINSNNLNNTARSVAALGALQQSVLAAGQAYTNRMVIDSIENVKKYKYHQPINNINSDLDTKYLVSELVLPLSGEVLSVRPGDYISYKTRGFYSDCFTSFLDGHKRQIGGHNHHVVAGEFVCKTSSDNDGYTPLYDNYRFQYGNISADQHLTVRRGKHSICHKNMGMYTLCVDTIDEQNIVKTIGFVELVDESVPLTKFVGFSDGKLLFQNYNTSEIISVDADENNQFEVFGINYIIISRDDGIQIQVL